MTNTQKSKILCHYLHTNTDTLPGFPVRDTLQFDAPNETAWDSAVNMDPSSHSASLMGYPVEIVHSLKLSVAVEVISSINTNFNTILFTKLHADTGALLPETTLVGSDVLKSEKIKLASVTRILSIRISNQDNPHNAREPALHIFVENVILQRWRPLAVPCTLGDGYDRHTSRCYLTP